MSSLASSNCDVDVVIVGAGPAGLTLACDLARRGARIRIVDMSMKPFHGSGGMGIQPRTIEVFDDLGVVRPLLQAGAMCPPKKAHLGFIALKCPTIKRHEATPDVPYPNDWLVPQWRTENVLRNRLAELGHTVEFGVQALDIEQDDEAATLHVQCRGVVRSIRTRYVVGADGGQSLVRKSLGVALVGKPSSEGRMIVGDVRANGLDRDCWHVWPTWKRGQVGLCPLPHSDLFQLVMPLDEYELAPDISEQAIQARWLAATGLNDIRLHSPDWLAILGANGGLPERYRVGRVFLAGDENIGHVSCGSSGLNMAVLDGYNLGWKLALVLNGAPEALLNTYEEERVPVAETELALASRPAQFANGGMLAKDRDDRGDQARQLKLNFRGSSISSNLGGARAGNVQAGDRAPDAPCARQQSGQTTLFDTFRGAHFSFTVLAFGARAIEAVGACQWRDARGCPAMVRVAAICTEHLAKDVNALVDERRHARAAYGVADDENITFVIRPDGYIGHIANDDWVRSISLYLESVAGFLLNQQETSPSLRVIHAVF